ncbi:hypothetical protein [Streptomyces sp. cf386]|uniref:hypothetical protein n=1 Tax=Streptomyces sp. cf386 TaxID=1761904 RepID=UPI00352372CB
MRSELAVEEVIQRHVRRLGVLAAEGCDVGLAGYEMASLADRAGELLTPQLVRDLHSAPMAAG